MSDTKNSASNATVKLHPLNVSPHSSSASEDADDVSATTVGDDNNMLRERGSAAPGAEAPETSKRTTNGNESPQQYVGDVPIDDADGEHFVEMTYEVRLCVCGTDRTKKNRERERDGQTQISEQTRM